MAVIAKLSTGVRPIGMPGDFEQVEGRLGEALAAGDAVRFDGTTGEFTGANSGAGEFNFIGILLDGGVAGEYRTAICKGEVAGFDLSALGFGDSVFLSATDKAIDTATSGTSTVVGKVFPGRASGPAFDKILKVGA